jgi:hypothetical protein
MGGSSYLDYLGFVMILSIDLLELSLVENYGIKVE